VIVGLALWRAATAVLAGEAQEEGDIDKLGEIGGEGDRMATVIPILRGFILAIIAVTTVLTALTALGVNVAPLLASAGVLGLAIGFGAQTLVTDVISGLFYLYEDAFRVGEYIETESGKGSVEKISLRSATLRHHRGAVITVPFSKMGTIQNHSRDWVVMKFTFSVPANTDVEMVRKLVKKVGLQMAEDPALEGKLLAPLKSQGAVGITGRNFDIGCKFMARPGEQWAIRRKAFAMLQEALNAKGVELAAPELNMAGLASR
jgi:small-conductance mechanosensitive channel